MTNRISPQQREALLETLQARFHQTMAFHPHTNWRDVLHALENAPQALGALGRMEDTGGEPIVVDDPEHPGRIVLMDGAAESPQSRRSLCYDQEALLARKNGPPAGSAVDMAEGIGIELLSETQYRALQALGGFDLKSSSWIKTPDDVRRLGGALFCDKRYGRVFTYHNGADSYYAARGFRGFLAL